MHFTLTKLFSNDALGYTDMETDLWCCTAVGTYFSSPQ